MRSRSLASGTAGPGRTLEAECPVLGGEQAEEESICHGIPGYRLLTAASSAGKLNTEILEKAFLSLR